MKEITLRKATADDARLIAEGFHTAMLYEDTPEEQLDTFARLICVREDVLYSWRNTTIAETEGKPIGMVTAYNGSRYSDMRKTTMTIIKDTLGIEFPGMEDEAVPGEYYIDSLAVLPEFRGNGVGRKLLEYAIKESKMLRLTATLAVEHDNEKAQKLYSSLGFTPDGELFIFGHNYQKMKIDYKSTFFKP